ncbi:hypothetical protein PMAYCL1PPCAC_30525 [Pristionchus mayeri]|uniref:Uncharacterized protein n=1 Tax=Pristionchus mayeri TaxID=1317129 RepID=A0AAN5IDR8_9BILA|nr:hypothetical protein PMAYCL1PPCAC_30525 [Pristionchus mayeri]
MSLRSSSSARAASSEPEAPSGASLSLEIDREMEQMRRLSLPSNHKVVSAKPRPSIVEIAEACGLLDMSPSDLVAETNKEQCGFRYYHCVLSSAFHSNGSATIFLANFDANTNLESLDSTKIPAKVFEDVTYPQTELALAVLGLLIYRSDVYGKRVLCLLRDTAPHQEDFSASLEPLKKAATKLRVTHHVQWVPPKEKKENIRLSVNAGMRLRVMLCQTRSSEDEPPRKAVYEAKALVDPSWNPFYCMCL